MDFRSFRKRVTPAILREVDQVMEDAVRSASNRFERMFLEELRSYALRESTRPASLVILGFEALGGRGADVNPVAAALHLLHTYFHTQDDVVDKDDVRNDAPTFWKTLEHRLSSFGVYDPHHINAIGFIGGNVARNLSQRLILEADLSKKTKEHLLRELNLLDLEANFGEFLELVQTAMNPKTLSEKDIMLVYKKLTRYWVYGALNLGRTVAGITDDVYRDFAIPLGVAAQLVNDLKDITTGRLSDIRERRVTFFIWYLYNHGERKDVAAVDRLLGKDYLTKREREQIQRVLSRSGAVEYVKEKALQLVDEARHALSKLEVADGYFQVFRDLVREIEESIK